MKTGLTLIHPFNCYYTYLIFDFAVFLLGGGGGGGGWGTINMHMSTEGLGLPTTKQKTGSPVSGQEG